MGRHFNIIPASVGGKRDALDDKLSTTRHVSITSLLVNSSSRTVMTCTAQPLCAESTRLNIGHAHVFRSDHASPNNLLAV